MVGILLAAGRGERFGGDKLLAQAAEPASAGRPALTDPGGELHRRARVPESHRRSCRGWSRSSVPDDAALAAALGAAGARVVRCANADDGMGASLACGVLATTDAAGWVVALGDMPWIQSSTIARVAGAIAGRRPGRPPRSIAGSAGIRWALAPAAAPRCRH